MDVQLGERIIAYQSFLEHPWNRRHSPAVFSLILEEIDYARRGEYPGDIFGRPPESRARTTQYLIDFEDRANDLRAAVKEVEIAARECAKRQADTTSPNDYFFE